MNATLLNAQGEDIKTVPIESRRMVVFGGSIQRADFGDIGEAVAAFLRTDSGLYPVTPKTGRVGAISRRISK